MNVEEMLWKVDKSNAKHKYFVKIETTEEVYSFDGVPVWIVAKILADDMFNGESIEAITMEPYLLMKK